jgi:hypothetical protein
LWIRIGFNANPNLAFQGNADPVLDPLNIVQNFAAGKNPIF